MLILAGQLLWGLRTPLALKAPGLPFDAHLPASLLGKDKNPEGPVTPDTSKGKRKKNLRVIMNYVVLEA